MTTITLPVPPSANNLFRNVRKGRVVTERYQSWLNAAGWELQSQRIAPIDGPVHLAIAINEKKTRCDLGNCEKATVDLLVKHGVIADDNKRVVRSISLYWSPNVDRCEVTITPAVSAYLKEAAE